MKINIRKLYVRGFAMLARFEHIDNFFLKINDKKNDILKALLRRSIEVRTALYSDGGIRLSTDHDIDVYFRWPAIGSIAWAEVASFNIQAMLQFSGGVRILDLGCANGWYYREFYSHLNNIEYVGCDLDGDIIDEANTALKKKIKQTKKSYNAKFLVANICDESTMPKNSNGFTNIFWYDVMCMFTKEQRKKIFLQIVEYLDKNNGILSGSAVIKNDAIAQWSHYVGLFNHEDDLRGELSQYFKNVYITRYSDENSRFFMASNGKLPCQNFVQ